MVLCMVGLGVPGMELLHIYSHSSISCFFFPISISFERLKPGKLKGQNHRPILPRIFFGFARNPICLTIWQLSNMTCFRIPSPSLRWNQKMIVSKFEILFSRVPFSGSMFLSKRVIYGGIFIWAYSHPGDGSTRQVKR